jgi:hypothetical protein
VRGSSGLPSAKPRFRRAGDLETARARILALQSELRASGSPWLPDEADALEVAGSDLEPDAYAARGRKNLYYDAWNRRRRNLR